MEVDRARRTGKFPPGACFRCGDTTHQVRDCPRSFDINFMDDDELEAELARRKDILEAQAHAQTVAESGAEAEEDFGTTNE